MVVPDTVKLLDFRKMVSPYFDKIKSNQKQLRSLSSLRDTLLPKLMSGAVKVNNLAYDPHH